MQGMTKLAGLSLQLLRPTHGLNRPEWRLLQRQWQRQLSSKLLTHPSKLLSPIVQRRYASTAAAEGRSVLTRLKNLLYGTAIILGLTFTYLYTTDTRAGIHQWLIVPSLRLIHSDPEEAHEAGTKYLKALYSFDLHPRERGNNDAKGDLRVEVFGHVLDNPIGTSAGIDKNAEIPSPLLALGPAIVEVGGATPHPQEGNPKPRVFRLPSQNALINRYGLNSEGADNVAMRLRQRVREFAYSTGLGLDPEAERQVLDGEAGVPPGSLIPGKLLAVQVAKNKATPDQDIDAVAKDYVYCVDALAKYADILVVNVSSPNTPGLRSLQASAPLTAILSSVVEAAKTCDRKNKPAVMVKVSPDEDSESQVDGICQAVWASGVHGIIVGNTTKKRPDPIPKGYIMPAKEEKLLTEMGGYSGPQMFERTLDLVKRYRRTLDMGPPADASAAQDTQKQVETGRPKSVERKADAAEGKAPTAAEKALKVVTENVPTEQPPEKIEASIARDSQRLKPLTPEAEEVSSQPLLQLPAHKFSAPEPAAHAQTTAKPPAATSVPNITTSSASSIAPSPPSSFGGGGEQKVIFATGGITNGEQCLQILNAGASVCQIYTAMIYGGVGTVSRIKAEMRSEMSNKK